MRVWLFVYWLLYSLSTSTYANSHHPQQFLSEVKGSKKEGLLIYEHFCSSCHAEQPLISLGAPRMGNASDWSIRLQQPIDVLIHHTEEGINAMPPRGGCFECSDGQLVLALAAMLPEKEQKKFLSDLKDHKKNNK